MRSPSQHSSPASFIRWENTRVILELHVQPGARTDAIAGVHGGRLKVKVAAPPVDGAANQQLLAYLAALFDVPRSQAKVLHGTSGRLKTVAIEGVTTLPAELSHLAGT